MLWARESIGRKPISRPRSQRPAGRRSRREIPRPCRKRSYRAEKESDSQMAEPVYRRVVIKLSGEYLAGAESFGIDQTTVDRIAGDLIAARQLGAEIAVVVGGGNIVRGVEVSSRGVSRPTGDTMGMLATVMNCLALEAAIERRGRTAQNPSAFVMPAICGVFTPAATHKKHCQGPNVLAGGR